jgi:hypothetical protein
MNGLGARGVPGDHPAELEFVTGTYGLPRPSPIGDGDAVRWMSLVTITGTGAGERGVGVSLN